MTSGEAEQYTASEHPYIASMGPAPLDSNFNTLKHTNPSLSPLRHVSRDHLKETQPARAPSASDDMNAEPSIHALPAWSSNAAQKKGNRATKRLEEERKEFERRLTRLEEDLTNEPTVLRRESRRLTKKQPLGKSSRSSSVDSDKSRSSFTAFFSASRRGSLTRSRSKTRNHESSSERTSVEQAQIDDGSGSQSNRPSLPLNLPERFGMAISTELAFKNNPLLQTSLQQSAPASKRHSGARKVSETPHANEVQKARIHASESEGSTSYFRGHSLNSETRAQDDSHAVSAANSPSSANELDRQSFAANLNPRKKNRASSVTSSDTARSLLFPRTPATQCETFEASDNLRRLQVSPAAKLYDRNSVASEGSPSSTRTYASLPLARESLFELSHPEGSADDFYYSRQKKFKSSPLAATPTTNTSMDESETGNTVSATDSFSNNTGKRTSTLTSSDQATFPLPSLGHRQKENKKLQKPPGSSSNTPNKPTASSQKSPLNDVTPMGRSSTREQNSLNLQHSRQQVLSWSGSSPEHPVHPAQIPADSRFYALSRRMPEGFTTTGNTRLSSTSGRLTLKATTSRSDPVVPTIGAYHKPALSETIPGLRVINTSPQGPLLPARSLGNADLSQRGRGSDEMESRKSSQESLSDAYNTADETASSIAESYSSVPQTTRPESTLQQHPPTANGASLPGTTNLQERMPLGGIREFFKGQSVDKMFTICCRCGFWHDMQSGVYPRLAHTSDLTKQMSSLGCFWCNHGISASCCLRWTTTVYMRERYR